MAPGGAAAQFGKLLAPVPTADGKALPALGGFPWLLLGPAQAGGALPLRRRSRARHRSTGNRRNFHFVTKVKGIDGR